MQVAQVTNKPGRKPGAPRLMTCAGCSTKVLTMAGWPFRCDPCKPGFVIGRDGERTGPIDRLERQAIRGSAHAAVARAIRDGLIAHPSASNCTDCGGAATEHDHRDYTQPLKVEPVCRGCNARRGPALVWTDSGRLPVRGYRRASNNFKV